MSFVILIPARSGSKRIKNKNLKLFNNQPLIYWTIKAALESNYLDRVIVSTEDEEIAEIAKSFSAEVPFMRPASLAQDSSQSIDLVLHALQYIPNVKVIQQYQFHFLKSILNSISILIRQKKYVP